MWRRLCLLALLVAAAVAEDEAKDVDASDDVAEADDAVASYPEDNDVVVLGDDNFDSFLAENPITLVEFYAPWCGHCKTLAPKYEVAAKTLKIAPVPVALAKVDATVHKEVAGRYDVSGYPTLKFFKDGEAVEYDGPRDEDGIIAWVQERADPSWKPPPEAVLTLTTGTFHETVGRENLLLVEFYAPWCGHCKKLAPEFEKAAKQLAQDDPPIALAKVDATLEPDLAKEYGVSGYPTLKVFRKGRAAEYKGPREQHGIVEHMRKQVGDASVLKTTVAEVTKAYLNYDTTDVAVLGVFASAEDPRCLAFIDWANDHRDDYIAMHSFSPEVAAHYGAQLGSVVVARPLRYDTKHEKPHYTALLEEDTDATLIATFVEEHEVPLVGELNDRTREKLYKKKRPLLVAFYSVDWSFDHRKATQIHRHKLADIAAKHQDEDNFDGEVTFAIADEETMKEMAKTFGFDESGEEMNIGLLSDKDKKYPMETFDSLDADDVHAFIKKFKAGKLKPEMKTQPAPKKKTPVAVVVGSTFDKIVKDPSKDVLIELYAPWCGHCKKLEPVYKELAKKLKKEKSVVIAKLDATANDFAEEFEASGFPTIYLAPAGKGVAPIKFEGGERDVDTLEKFVRDNAVTLKGRDEL